MKLFLDDKRGPDGFRYWPMCPHCEEKGVRGYLSCVQREPNNAVPARVYGFECQRCGGLSAFSHREIVRMQRRRAQQHADWIDAR